MTYVLQTATDTLIRVNTSEEKRGYPFPFEKIRTHCPRAPEAGHAVLVYPNIRGTSSEALFV